MNNSKESFLGKYPCIRRVSGEIRKLNERAYSPSAVSIGPLHRKNKHLQAIEDMKLTYMASLFGRIQKLCPTRHPDQTRETCLDIMLQMEPCSRKFYAECIKLEKKKFADMMLKDGCFIIELLFRHSEKSKDPIVGNPFLFRTVKEDLLLFENQIPYLVLQKLFDLTVGSCINANPIHSFLECILPFFANMMIFDYNSAGEEEKKKIIESVGQNVYHILHLVHKIHQPSSSTKPTKDPNKIHQPSSSTEPTNDPNLDPYKIDQPSSSTKPTKDPNKSKPTKDPRFPKSATDLVLSGVKLGKYDADNLFNVEFSREPCSCFWMCRSAHFKIPPFHIYDSTDLLLRNLIALEQCHDDIEPHFTSYAKFMDTLVNSAKDVEHLEAAGVIVNNLGCREDVSNLFNNLCKHIDVDVYETKFYFTQRCMELNQYCDRCWPTNLAKLKRDYFGSPWSGIALGAGIFVFLFTIMGTIYTIMAYYYN